MKSWYICECVYAAYTHNIQAFSGPNCFIHFFFLFFFFSFLFLSLLCLMMNLFEGHFLQNKGFDAYSFLRETGVVLFPEENCTVKTGLVVTHSVFKFFFFFFLSHYHTNWILLTMFVICWFVLTKFGWCHPLHCWSEILLINYLAICRSRYGQCSHKTKMAGQTSCVCKYKKMTVLYMCFLCDSGVFPSSEASLKETVMFFV